MNEEYIIPSVFNKAVVQAVAQAVTEAAYRTGVARRESKVLDDVQSCSAKRKWTRRFVVSGPSRGEIAHS